MVEKSIWFDIGTFIENENGEGGFTIRCTGDKPQICMGLAEINGWGDAYHLF